MRPYPGPAQLDEHGLPDDMIDREGNPVRPVFSTDEIALGTGYGADAGAVDKLPYQYRDVCKEQTGFWVSGRSPSLPNHPRR